MEARRLLWISRYLPCTLDTGGKVYSARLSAAVAEAGADVTLLGFGPDSGQGPAVESPIERAVESVAIPGERRSAAWTVLSRLPFGAAIDRTKAARATLKQLLRQPWDAVVFDGYATGWALDEVEAHATSHGASGRPTLVYVSHNHEAQVWRDMAREGSGNAVRRAALRVNARRVTALEGRLLSAMDLLTAITDTDRAALTAGRRDLRSITLTPGFSGTRLPDRRIDAKTPRRVLVFGSFRWVVKQDNLRRFVKAADEDFHRHGIGLDVVGDVPDQLKEELRPWTRATRFHGFVDAVEPFLEGARIGVVPEEMGGGFKLKFLDYFFGGLPVVTIDEATSGLPEALRREVISTPNMSALVDAVIEAMDDVSELDARQRRSYTAARELFSWPDRGSHLWQNLMSVGTQPSGLQDPALGS